MFPRLSRRVRRDLTRAAERTSADAFCANLRRVLLAPPLRGAAVLGIDPGFAHGCKLAAVSKDGEVMGTGVVYPCQGGGGGKGTIRKVNILRSPKFPNRVKNFFPSTGGSNFRLGPRDKKTLSDLVVSHGVTHVSIGDGTASREAEAALAAMISGGDFGEGRDLVYAITSEQGTSIYR